MTDVGTLYRTFLSCPGGVVTDSRRLVPGALFIALKGGNFDGNLFAAAALEGGCSYAMVDDPGVIPPGEEGRFLLVDDGLEALRMLAREHRRALGTKLIGVTGTNGKTTTKELLRAVLSRKYRVLATEGNLNNDIGVPLTLLRLRPEHELAVVETGANHPGEIASLSAIVEPDCGLITNVGRAHLEGFGSFDGVVRTKGELYDWLRRSPEGFIFLHKGDTVLEGIAGSLPRFTYGEPGLGCDVEGEVTACAPFLRLRWRPAGGTWHEVQTHLIGAYNLWNVLAAVAVGMRFGVEPARITSALESYVPSNSRSELRQTARNTLIVDAYNANPTSMKAALDNFALIPHPHKMVILGDMRELGEASAEEHRRVAARAGALGCEAVWLVGPEFASCELPCSRHFASVDEVKAAIAGGERPEGRLILIKGSNGTHLFELPDLL